MLVSRTNKRFANLANGGASRKVLETGIKKMPVKITMRIIMMLEIRLRNFLVGQCYVTITILQFK